MQHPHTEPVLEDETCECCGGAVKQITIPALNTESRKSVRCTNCPAGGDILPNGRRVGPVFHGAHGAESDALDWHTPPEHTDQSAGEKA